MNVGIALLLRGSSADLSAALHSIELAKRTTREVHAVLLQRREDGRSKEAGEEGEHGRHSWNGQFTALAGLLGDAAEITVHIHLLDSLADEQLLRFLCEYRIFCLIQGARDRRAARRKNAWVDRLRQRLAGLQDCFLPPLWSVIIEPWDDPAFETHLTGFTRATWSTTAMKMLAGSLRNGLNGLNNTRKPGNRNRV